MSTYGDLPVGYIFVDLSAAEVPDGIRYLVSEKDGNHVYLKPQVEVSGLPKSQRDTRGFRLFARTTIEYPFLILPTQVTIEEDPL